MTYDQWKTTDPNDNWLGLEPEEDEECLHEDYYEDILTGACDCPWCGARWYHRIIQPKESDSK